MGLLISPFLLITFLLFLIAATNGHAVPHHEHNGNIARRSITLNLERNPNYTPNGPAAYARALRKWGADVPVSLTNSLTAMRDDGESSTSIR
jgi:hypothetical protein